MFVGSQDLIAYSYALCPYSLFSFPHPSPLSFLIFFSLYFFFHLTIHLTSTSLSLLFLFISSPTPLPIFPRLSLSLSLELSSQVQQRRSQSPCLCGTSGSACWCVQSGVVSSWGWTLALDMAVSWQFSPLLVSDHIVYCIHVYTVAFTLIMHVYVVSLGIYFCIQNTFSLNSHKTILIYKVASFLLHLLKLWHRSA